MLKEGVDHLGLSVCVCALCVCVARVKPVMPAMMKPWKLSRARWGGCCDIWRKREEGEKYKTQCEAHKPRKRTQEEDMVRDMLREI